MSAQIIFLTGFLGLAAGRQPIAVEVSGPVSAVRVMLADREVAVMKAPPWRTEIDFGSELTPRELTAIAVDEKGNESARVSQLINLPRPTAEFDIDVTAYAVRLRWRHLTNTPPAHG